MHFFPQIRDEPSDFTYQPAAKFERAAGTAKYDSPYAQIDTDSVIDPALFE